MDKSAGQPSNLMAPVPASSGARPVRGGVIVYGTIELSLEPGVDGYGGRSCFEFCILALQMSHFHPGIFPSYCKRQGPGMMRRI